MRSVKAEEERLRRISELMDSHSALELAETVVKLENQIVAMRRDSSKLRKSVKLERKNAKTARERVDSRDVHKPLWREVKKGS